MSNTQHRRQLMAARDIALRTGDIPAYQRLTVQIAALPMPGVRPLTQRDITRYTQRKERMS